MRLAPRPLLLALMMSAYALPLHAADLVTITRDALQNNAELASARAELQGVEAGRDVSRGGLLPQLGASANATHNRQYESQTNGLAARGAGVGAGDDRYNSAGVTLEATQALFDAIARREVEQSERQIDQQTYLLASVEQQVLIDVAVAYFDILRAHEVLEARRAQERAIERQLDQAREEYEVGLTAVTSVHEAQATFDQARAERTAAEGNVQVSFEALERLTGTRYASIEALGDDMPIAMPSPSGRAHWVEQAIARNPSILAQQAGVELSRSGVSLARAQRLPTLEAFANYQYADSDSDVVEGHDSSSQVGLSLSMPLYTGGSTSARIRQSTFQLESSQYDFEAQRRDTVQQVRSLYTQVSNDVETVEAREQAIVSNRSALEATRAGYEVGTRNIVDVLNAEQNLYNAIADYAEARYDYVVDLLSLRQQSGTLDVATIEEVNGWLSGGSIDLALPDDDADLDRSVMQIGEPPRQGS